MKMPTKQTMNDENHDIFVVSPSRTRYAGPMFATKPASPSLEFDELAHAFDRGALATLFDRDPDTVGRWRKARRVPHTVEMVVDRFWWVMHVACVEREWPLDDARYFLLSIHPALGRRPAELVRESDEDCQVVVKVLADKPAPAEQEDHTPTSASPPAASQSPFAELLAAEPGTDEVFNREYRLPSLAGRARPIGGTQEDADPFRFRYTATTTHAIPLGGAASVGV
jgi:hypothetical protein